MVSEYLITPAPNPPRSTDNADWIAKAKALIRDMGAHAAIDSVGGALAEDLTALLGWEGLLVTFGTATGAPLKLSSGTLITKHITIKGFWGAKVIEKMDPEKRRTLIVGLMSLAAQGKLTLDTEAIFPLGKIQNAVKSALIPSHKGKVLLRP
ncbi:MULTISPECIES: zinc-binding dehydrogenase [Roseobacteraceae]|uniref:Nuclear receptor-binding factor-like protein n=1 Tax=Celeribacter baekdonensis B30 TaxID=1208323 RepID=K2IZM9_9RHOB|nr:MULTISPECIES: zinc-binding dehydrogenase [Roseobacteraceae]EKE68007.1 nuclear receptor-binding factor-like protein [Celeribacter baekdonensis B30]|tara:strand:+ start:4427 stop:4882 length:456 start_codon:yes stop_codon:yes gene_type:complete